jgi:hypothetical protein
MGNDRENKLLDRYFPAQVYGKTVERGCLGIVSKEQYERNLEIALYKELLKEIDDSLCDYYHDFVISNQDSTFGDFIAEVEKNNPYVKDDLINVHKLVQEILSKRVKGDRYRYIKQLKDEELFKIVEESQGSDFDSSDPKNAYASDLHAIIAEQLGLDDYSDLEYYCSVDTHLDKCGVDAFFKFKYLSNDGSEKQVTVCCDLTTKTESQKLSEIKAKKMANEKIFTDVILCLTNDEVEQMKKIYTNRRLGVNKDSEDFKKARRCYKHLLKIHAERIIKNFELRKE